MKDSSFFLANHHACGHLFIVELFSHADCWHYLICHCFGCDLGRWVSPGTITEGIHSFHLMLPPASQRQGLSLSTLSVHRLQWEPKSFEKLGSSSHVMPERTPTSGVPKHQKPTFGCQK